MKKKLLLVLVVIISAVPKSFSQAIDTTINIEEFEDLIYWNSKPISKLPEHIPIRKNEIYLYADYTSITDESIPVYIINNTAESFKYDGYLMSLLQQEFKDSINMWLRSQSFFFGWCGSGYLMEAGIRPIEFIIVWRSFLDVGEEHEIRYSFYSTNVTTSNRGTGKINMEGVEKAKYDDIALKISGSEFLIKIIYGEIAPIEIENKSLINRAICNLAYYYPEEAIPILQQFAKDSSSVYQRQAITNLESIEKRKQKK